MRRLNDLMLRGMEDAGLVKWNRDESGKQVGLMIEGQVTFSDKDAMSADSTVARNSEGID
ncbi:MAG TPA: hypothetical protein VN956_07325 [Pyrinomonadaceae bacterium]|nr:hypothetical protein [Pyrinomonadaceae bacterium]